MSFEIDWYRNFFSISWAHERDRLVISTVFEDKEEAIAIAHEIENWSEKFTRLFRTGMRQSSGYEQAKPIIEEKSPLLQIAYAADVRDINTYEQISRLVPMRKCRIISEKNLKKQEFYYEKTANQQNQKMKRF